MTGDHLQVDQSLSLLDRSPTYIVQTAHLTKFPVGVWDAPLRRLWVNAATLKCFVAMFEYRLSLIFILGVQFYRLGNLNDQILPNYSKLQGLKGGFVLDSGAIGNADDRFDADPKWTLSPGVCASFSAHRGIRMFITFITVRLKMSGWVLFLADCTWIIAV